MNKKMVRVDMLREGTRFEIPSLNKTMKNMRLVSVSDCSSLIEGQRRDMTAEPWKPFRYHISNAVLVQPISDEVFNETPSDNTVNNTTIPKKGRGRPPKKKVVFKNLSGLDGNFTVSSLIESNDLKEYEAHNLVKSALSSGTIQQVGEVKGGRGKPKKVYKLI